MGYKKDSNKHYLTYGDSNEPLDGLLIEDKDGNIIARLDKDGIKTGNGETLVDNNGKKTREWVSDTQSGDGTTTTFTIAHNLGVAPSHAVVTAATADAEGNYHISDLTSDHVEITYGTAPADATDNLSWHVLVKK